MSIAWPSSDEPARELGFSIEDVRELLDLAGHRERPCAGIDQIAARHLGMIEAKIATLIEQLRRELRDTLAGCARQARCEYGDAERYRRTDCLREKNEDGDDRAQELARARRYFDLSSEAATMATAEESVPILAIKIPSF